MNISGIGTDFLLLALSGSPELQPVLFLVVGVLYSVTLLGNTALIVVSVADPRLHTPMYFFLCHLSILDICYTTTTVPTILVGTLIGRPRVSFASCIMQMYLFISLGGSESFLLAAMAYDRYAAICHPLHYASLMNRRTCTQLAAGSWACGFLDSVLHTAMTAQLPFCASHSVNYFFCHAPPLVELSCSGARDNQVVMFAAGAFMVLAPFLSTVVSYICIISAVLQIPSAHGRNKAFSTCTSHLTVVVLFYGSSIVADMTRITGYSLGHEQFVALFYSVVTPLLNPLIYSLRNSQVKDAMRTMFCRNLKVAC